jgi:hypothetical protein
MDYKKEFIEKFNLLEIDILFRAFLGFIEGNSPFAKAFNQTVLETKSKRLSLVIVGVELEVEEAAEIRILLDRKNKPHFYSCSNYWIRDAVEDKGLRDIIFELENYLSKLPGLKKPERPENVDRYLNNESDFDK